MRIDFLGLQAFLAIAERGSFQAAATHLALSQTALSHRIRKLEADLGTRLFDRTTRVVSLTPAGVELLPKVREAMAGLGEAVGGLRDRARSPGRTLAIGCLPTLAASFLPAVLQRFRALHPGLALRVHDNSATAIASLVEAGTVAFGITLVAAPRWDFVVEPLAEDPFVLVCPAGHRLAAAASARWEDLAGMPLVRVSPQTGNRMILDDALGARADQLAWAYEVQHVVTALALVREGAALTVLPRLAVNPAGAEGLRLVPLEGPCVARQLGIIWRRSSPPSPLAEELKAAVSAAFAAIPR